jgi:large conductance mechanosensitive channel
MIKEFRNFLMRGNIVELAVAVIVGTAFALVVKSLNDNLLTPIVAMIGGKRDFSSLVFSINGAQFRYGAFLTDALSFVLTAAAVFFFVVHPINTIVARRRRDDIAEPAETPEEIELLREIRDALRAR